VGEIKIISRDMHLAAYMKANGAELVAVQNKSFIFKSELEESAWRLKHSNSCCKRVDDELLALKRMI
jgi:hypothetical protein